MSGERRRDVQVHQVLATLAYGDAIGNEVLGIRDVLTRAGYASRIYVQTADARLEDDTEDYRDLITNAHRDDILIHHFSIGSRASRIAFALPGRMILVYHNITPPSYFIGVNKTLVKLCFAGRRELHAYVNRCALALGDSEYNRRELEEMGFPRTDVLPVVPSFRHLDGEPDPLLSDGFNDDWTNILFVGRIIPNKRIEDLIRFFYAYRTRYNPRSRLILVGSHSGFADYVASLHMLMASQGVPDVHLVGHVSNEELTALYGVADVFLSASEHEGFCVPLLEAFYKQIPVVAYAATAVPDTMDGGGVLYEHKDPRHVASLIHAIVSDAALRDEIIRSQDEALTRLTRHDFGALLLGFVDQVKQTPPSDPPVVTTDFWSHHEQAERLETLHQTRPSAYAALSEEMSGAARQESK
jgi:glycosyltransferase involved in cell wall biosynthesis